MPELLMPSLGADMERGRLLEWLVQPGQAVARGDIVAVIDTDKAEIEIETFDDGVIGDLLVEPGTEVPVGATLATILAAGAGAERPSSPPPGGQDGRSVTPDGTPADERPPSPPPGGQDGRSVTPDGTPADERPPSPPPGGQDGRSVTGDGTPADERPSSPPPGGQDGRSTAPQAEARIHATPLARRVAADLGIDLHDVHGSGPHGSVVRADVEDAAPAAPATPAPTVPLAAPAPATHATPATPATPATHATHATHATPATHATHATHASRATAAADASAATPAPAPTSAATPGTHDLARQHDRQAAMREAIGALMARSAREIPHYHLGTHVDLARATEFLARHNDTLPVTRRLLPAALLLKATALAARATPAVNGHWRDGALHESERVHLGVAISLRGGGLVAPAIHDADTLKLDDLMTALRDLVERARRGRLRNSEMTDATLTVTNLGERGVETVHGVIYPPQVALVGFGRIVERPWAVDGMLAVRPVVHATLAADHRASDGHAGGLFLRLLDHHLQEPDHL